jgi:hypothetical protein
MSASTANEARILGELGAGICPGLAQTFDRRYINGTLAPASGTMYVSGIFLPAGMTITNIVLYTGGTGVTTNTNNWAALYALDPSTTVLKFMAQSTTDASGTDYAANTKVTKALSAAQTTTYTGLHYIAWMQAASTPALIAAAVAPASSIANSDTPIPSASSSTGLTTAAPSPAGALTAVIQSFYAYVT